jgi:glycosyltransferase involved in cell wall biosynthesis
MNDKSIFLSVVIPAFNEEKNFQAGKLNSVYDYLKKQQYSFELILVDDGSTDNTVSLLKKFASFKDEVRVIEADHKGKAPTVSRGMLEAKGRNRLFTDFDQATPIGEVEKLFPFRKKDYDVVIGSREVAGARREKEPFYRHLMGRVFNLVVRIFAVRGIQDTQCGFKLFSDVATKDLFSRLPSSKNPKVREDPFTGAFDVELLFLARKNKFRIAEVPVGWKHVKTERVSPIKDSIRMFFEVLLIRLNYLLGRYKIPERNSS